MPKTPIERIEKLENRTVVLETKLEIISDNIKKIMDNHLAHIQDRLDKMDRRITYFAAVGGTLLIVAQLLIRFLK